MEQLLNEIQTKINYLQSKYDKDRENRLNNTEIVSENEWTNDDAFLLRDLLNVCKYLHTVCYNSVLDQIKQNDNSFVEIYCNAKKEAILNEIPKHRSKYILKELKEELKKLERVIENKERFIDSIKIYNTSFESVAQSISNGRSYALGEQLTKVYFDKNLNPSYKVVLEHLLSNNFENYNKLGNLNHIGYITMELNELSNMWEINNSIDNFLNNDLSNIKEENVYKEVSNYVSKLIKYRDYLKKYDVELPKNNGNYLKEVQDFLLKIKNNKVFENIIDELNIEYTNIKDQLPKEYLDIEYGFFGTVSGKPGVAYYFDSPNRIEEAENLKYIYEILARAKELEGKNLGNKIVVEAHGNIEHSIDEKISSRKI